MEGGCPCESGNDDYWESSTGSRGNAENATQLTPFLYENHLLLSLKTEAIQLLSEFSHMFLPLPGRNGLIEHHTLLLPRGWLYTATLTAYPKIKKEGSEGDPGYAWFWCNWGVQGWSDWSSPVVLVPKTDGLVYFCVDFRKIKAVFKFDRLDVAHFDLALGLPKGYWQIHLTLVALRIGAFPLHLAYTNLSCYHLVCLEHQPHFNNSEIKSSAHMPPMPLPICIRPLTDITKKGALDLVQWKELCKWVFNQLKAAVCAGPYSDSPDFSIPFCFAVQCIRQRAMQGYGYVVLCCPRWLRQRSAQCSTSAASCCLGRAGIAQEKRRAWPSNGPNTSCWDRPSPSVQTMVHYSSSTTLKIPICRSLWFLALQLFNLRWSTVQGHGPPFPEWRYVAAEPWLGTSWWMMQCCGKQGIMNECCCLFIINVARLMLRGFLQKWLNSPVREQVLSDMKSKQQELSCVVVFVSQKRETLTLHQNWKVHMNYK